MGFGFLSSILVLSLVFGHALPQQPNTDGSYVSDFLRHTSFVTLRSQRSVDVCSWQGVVCDAEQGRITGLFFSNMGLSGTLPDDTIGKLSKLQSLDLSGNNIIGLSSDFWSLGSLKTLNLSYNQLSGGLPNNIGNFGLLETLDLSWNNFSGEIPAAFSSLGSLQVLKLNQNGFQSSIPSGFLNFKSLVSMDLSWNRLNGPLPGGFFASFPKLKTLNLAGNEIEGSDSDFLNMKSMTSLNMSRNQFQGSVLGIFQNPLEVIDLSWNKFDGHISQAMNSSSVFFNWSTLVHLDLSENQLRGEIFSNFSQFWNLKHLNLANNRFSKQEFPHISMLSGIQYLNLSRTNLTGTIPLEVSQLSSLNVLDLSQNHLVGKIQNLSTKELQILDVSYNNLSGEIPVLLLQRLPLMEKFNFSFNNLTLCASEFSSNTLQASSFIGTVNSCPVAVKPDAIGRTNKDIGFKLALALALSMVCLLAGLLFLAFGCRRKTRSMWAAKQHSCKEEQNASGPFSFQTDSTTWVADVKQATAVQVVIFEKPLLNFTFADLLSATSNFDRGTLLAEGKFGPVYRGFLPGGIHVAVKVLVHGSILTDQEAARELEYLGRIKHPNLVPLTGYCLAGEQRIAMYDYMENGNLQNLLHDLPLGVQATEDWSTDTWEDDVANGGITHVGSEGLLTTWGFRHKIALGTARGLAFLHHGCSPPITHRDIKASSVYLDSNLEPRLSDFGLVKIFANGLDDEIFRGSPGYIPPEFSQAAETSESLGNVTPKSDVYGFGVVLFELITGKKPVGDEYPEKEASLVSWVRGMVRKNEGSRVIDPKIRGTGSVDQMEEALKIGYLCTADLPSKRPSMQQIVGLLKDIEPVRHQ